MKMQCFDIAFRGVHAFSQEKLQSSLSAFSTLVVDRDEPAVDVARRAEHQNIGLVVVVGAKREIHGLIVPTWVRQQIRQHGSVDADSLGDALAELERRLSAVELEAEVGSADPGRRVIVPVLYDGADLEAVAARLGLSPSQVVDLHLGVEYHVFAIGFLPGFPYAGYLPPALAGLPRRDVPRLRVPAGSVTSPVCCRSPASTTSTTSTAPIRRCPAAPPGGGSRSRTTWSSGPSRVSCRRRSRRSAAR